ncbi:SigB/SigF/SigG family RNA polymerase sigma factor [Gordonia sp. zg691]|uniref:SigB/SigF/SigG family RNA polymerase sigma factor n=1 Tax=Gordonia jinghuaiqii TaxID=2758710 RepID=A0A7D7LVS9_9ACTN|nr:SigB/SigF/SigG family RNA polymerase sigma factor [Gordonia jinghuaiqii]MBD0863620.1 SigB/SigF/SigG family RNA polymerase sigma factor [Gordonia jinghuaiqii]MCR5979356.1 SigB/SigF/SigG family RNA polymerase sigma factor [Gordonia jinghuaiqii]QMT01139.1 SigB/SigF/SigG family RNA polymerase sigma factor [Gordonia jinghuaiqii]
MASRERGDHDDYGDVAPALRSMHDEPDDDRRAQLRDVIIERCLPLADHVARRFSERGEPIDDLRQVARIGLMHAIDRFDVERGNNFLAFAVPTVMGEVKRYFRDSTWSIRVPRRAQEASLNIAKASEELLQSLGRSPRPSELAEHLGIPVAEVIEGMVARSAYTASSIDAETSASADGWTLADTLGDDDERLELVEEFVTLQPALERLTDRERTILTLRFFKSMSQSEIARHVGISQMHVSRLLTRILENLRAEVVVDESEETADA